MISRTEVNGFRSVLFLSVLSLFYGRTGNVAEAKKELRTALELAPNDADAQNALAVLERAHEERVK